MEHQSHSNYPYQDFDKYMQEAFKFAIYKDRNYPYFAIMEELGEFMTHLAKDARGDKEADEEKMKKELGDILWQMAAICAQRGWSFAMIANNNLAKLSKRQADNTIKGDGDDR